MISQNQISSLAAEMSSFNVDDDTVNLITKMFTEKLESEDIEKIEKTIDGLYELDRMSIIKTIFEIAEQEQYPFNKSTASKGAMGVANFFGQRIKNLRVFFRGHYFDKKAIKVVAEGDSWFEHAFIKDIIDWMIRKSNMRVYPLAYGGDWIGNYLADQKFINKLKEKEATVFLLSGGGNDLVGKVTVNGEKVPRLQILLENKLSINENPSDEDIKQIINESNHPLYDRTLAHSIFIGKQFWRKEFSILFNIFRFQYLLIIRLVKLHSEIKIIGQGYDFAIPDSTKHNLFRKLLGHGGWLSKPLNNLNIDTKYHQDIINSMMHEFNKMLIEITNIKNNFHFIDCRFAARKDQWNDELHLHSEVYEVIADQFLNCINSSDGSKKVFRVAS
jgi:hypothetical protein